MRIIGEVGENRRGLKPIHIAEIVFNPVYQVCSGRGGHRLSVASSRGQLNWLRYSAVSRSVPGRRRGRWSRAESRADLQGFHKPVQVDSKSVGAPGR
jgi:hypothetical protein